MTKQQRKAQMKNLTYIELQEIIDNGNRTLEMHRNIIKAEKNYIIKNIMAAKELQSKYVPFK